MSSYEILSSKSYYISTIIFLQICKNIWQILIFLIYNILQDCTTMWNYVMILIILALFYINLNI